MSKQVVLVVPSQGVVLNPQRRLKPTFTKEIGVFDPKHTSYWYGFIQGYADIGGHRVELPESGIVTFPPDYLKWWELVAGVSVNRSVSLADRNLKTIISDALSTIAPGFVLLVNPTAVNAVQEALWSLQILQDVIDFNGRLSIG